jgi:hypothetical protein
MNVVEEQGANRGALAQSPSCLDRTCKGRYTRRWAVAESFPLPDAFIPKAVSLITLTVTVELPGASGNAVITPHDPPIISLVEFMDAADNASDTTSCDVLANSSGKRAEQFQNQRVSKAWSDGSSPLLRAKTDMGKPTLVPSLPFSCSCIVGALSTIPPIWRTSNWIVILFAVFLASATRMTAEPKTPAA